MHQKHIDFPRNAGKVLRSVLILLGAFAVAGVLWWQYSRYFGSGANAPAASAPASGTGGPGGAGRRFGGNGGSGNQPVSVQEVRRQNMRVSVSAIGSLAAANTAVVRAQITGTLQSIQFREGQQIKAGQLLAQIDPRSFQAQVSQAQGALARDTAQLENARTDLTRYQDLLSKDAIPRQQLDTQQALVRQLEGSVLIDRGALDNAQLQLSYTRVIAPISGRVGLKQADLGNVVQPSDPNGIVSIAQTHPIALVFSVPASLVPQINGKLLARQALKVQALAKGGDTALASGQVLSIDNAIDPTTDTIKVKALFPNTDDALFPNQSVGVRLQLDTLKDALTVPQAAVLRGAQGFYVYVVKDDNSVATQVVQPGVVDGNWMAVSADLQPGQKVVVDGVDRLRNGAKVEIITPDRRAAAAGGGKSGGQHGNKGAGAAAPAAPTPSSDAAPDAQRRAFFQSLSPQEREKLKQMSPEERQAWRAQHHAPSAPSAP
jgi:multidrug efflux system membrane fusion protein